MSNTDRRFVVGAELRAADTKAGLTITARAVKYGALSEPNIPVAGGRECIAKGAFRDSLASGTDVLALYQHDQSQPPLGRLKNGSLLIQDMDDGLYFTVKLNPSVQYHRDIHELVKDGSIDACSFGFAVNPDGDKWTNERDASGQPYLLRTVKSAKLMDCSLVLSPAYGNGATSVQARSISYRFNTNVQARSFANRLFRGPQGEQLIGDQLQPSATPTAAVDADLEAQKRKAHGQYQRINADFRAAGLATKPADRARERQQARERVKNVVEQIREAAESND